MILENILRRGQPSEPKQIVVTPEKIAKDRVLMNGAITLNQFPSDQQEQIKERFVGHDIGLLEKLSPQEILSIAQYFQYLSVTKELDDISWVTDALDERIATSSSS